MKPLFHLKYTASIHLKMGKSCMQRISFKYVVSFQTALI
jgi:hypothetical protein